MRAAGRGLVTTKMADISLNAALTRPIFVACHMASAAVNASHVDFATRRWLFLCGWWSVGRLLLFQVSIDRQAILSSSDRSITFL